MQDAILHFGATTSFAAATTDDSENVIDLAAVSSRGGGSSNLVIWAIMTTALSTATDITITVEDSADNASFADTTISTAPVLAAAAVAGAKWEIPLSGNTLRRYIQLRYNSSSGNLVGGIEAGININGIGVHVGGL